MRLYAFLMGIIRVLVLILWHPKYEGRENIPNTGPVVYCANHIHWADPVLMACACHRQLHFMAKHELFELPIFRWLLPHVGMFPIKRGKVDTGAIRAALAYLNKGEVLGIFPEGTRSKTGELLAFFNGASYFAVKSGAVIIPVGITGSYRVFSRMRVRVGDPIDVAPYSQGGKGSANLDELSHRLMQEIDKLRGNE
ncbi:MAG: lysophospholipid acyltransferase family protein [Bacillota bacterium]